MTERKPRYTDEERLKAFEEDEKEFKSDIMKLEAVLAHPDWYDEGVPEAAAKWLAFLKQEVKPSVDELADMQIEIYPKIRNILERGQ